MSKIERLTYQLREANKLRDEEWKKFMELDAIAGEQRAKWLDASGAVQKAEHDLEIEMEVLKRLTK